MTTSIMIVGVGGQGSVLIGKVLGSLLLKKGYDIKVSETHGMSQRGGSVVTNIRYGDKVFSPLICKGEADYIIALEMLEAALSLEYLKHGGVLLVNEQKISPMAVITGKMKYPINLNKRINSLGINISFVDGNGKALQAGSVMATNIVLLGYFSIYLNQITVDEWLQTIEECIPNKYVEINKKAFLLGLQRI